MNTFLELRDIEACKYSYLSNNKMIEKFKELDLYDKIIRENLAILTHGALIMICDRSMRIDNDYVANMQNCVTSFYLG